MQMTVSNTTGYVGIGTTAPNALLDVNGTASATTFIGYTGSFGNLTATGYIKPGSASTCNAGTSGAIRYTAGSPPYEYCNGSSWSNFSSAGGGDLTPSAFTFTNLSGQLAGHTVSSGLITVAGLSNPSGMGVSATITTANSAGFSVNGGPWLTAGYVANGDVVQLQQTTGYTGNTNYTATFTIGTASNAWVAATAANVCPAGFVKIPGSEGVSGYTDGWCVSKYLMTPQDTAQWTQDSTYYGWRFDTTTGAATKYVAAKAGQNPITYIARNEAATACSSYLKDANGNVVNNGKLLTVALWNTLMTDITNTPGNWSGGSVGSGYMSRGHANNTPAYTIPTSPTEAFPSTANMTASGGYYWSRTYKTSLGDIIWDMAGNVWEWFDDLHGSAGTTNAWAEFTTGTYALGSTSLEPATTTWNSNQGVGQIYNVDGATVGSTYAAQFGGNWNHGAYAGPWTSRWNGYSPSSDRGYFIGFRCIAPAQ